MDFGLRATSNQGPPVRFVTVAPARSAIRPAAAMSHDDSPPCWTKASKRPLPTYASASAAEPIDLETRISFRIVRARPRFWAPESEIDTTKSDSRSLVD